MVFFGADVEALRALAASMERSASALNSSAGSVDGAVMRATAWTGPAADRFRAQWSGHDRRQITSLASTLQEYARRLRANANAQAQASAASAGAAGGSSIAPGQALSAVNDFFKKLKPVGEADSIFSRIVLTADHAHDISDVARGVWSHDVPWRTAFDDAKKIGQEIGTFDDPGGKAKEVLENAVTDAEERGASSLGDLKDLRDAGEWLGKAGKVLGLTGAVVDSADAVVKLTQHQESASDLLETIGTDLKTSKNPVAYTWGITASVLATDSKMIETTDFSPSTLKLIGQYVASNPSSLIPALGAGLGDVVKGVPGWVL